MYAFWYRKIKSKNENNKNRIKEKQINVKQKEDMLSISVYKIQSIFNFCEMEMRMDPFECNIMNIFNTNKCIQWRWMWLKTNANTNQCKYSAKWKALLEKHSNQQITILRLSFHSLRFTSIVSKKKLTLSLRCVQLIRNKFAAYSQYIQVAKCLLGTSIVFGSIDQTIWNEILYWVRSTAERRISQVDLKWNQLWSGFFESSLIFKLIHSHVIAKSVTLKYIIMNLYCLTYVSRQWLNWKKQH